MFTINEDHMMYSSVPNCTGGEGGGQIADFGKKTPQVHLIIIRE